MRLQIFFCLVCDFLETDNVSVYGAYDLFRLPKGRILVKNIIRAHLEISRWGIGNDNIARAGRYAQQYEKKVPVNTNPLHHVLSKTFFYYKIWEIQVQRQIQYENNTTFGVQKFDFRLEKTSVSASLTLSAAIQKAHNRKEITHG
jgi:hypothetical protein